MDFTGELCARFQILYSKIKISVQKREENSERTYLMLSSTNRQFQSECIIKEISSFRIALPQIIAVTIKNMLFIEFGMALGFPTILIPSLSGSDSTEKIHMNAEAISWIGSVNFICVPLGSIISGPVTQRFGRKRCMQLVTLPFLASWLLFYFSNEAWQIYLALCITGVSGGLLEAPVLSYVAEVTQPHLRGMLSSTSTMSVTLGTLLQFILGTFLRWRQATLVNCFVPVLCLILVSLIPESPLWLLSKNKKEDAKKSLQWLRGWTQVENIQNEFDEMSLKLLGSQKQQSNQQSVLEPVKFLGKKEVYWPLSLVTFAFFLCHFNGTTSVTTYAVVIFKAMHAPINEYYATIIVGTVQLLGCITSISFVHLLGRRKLNFISILGSGVCFLIVSSYVYVEGFFYLYKPDELLTENTQHWVAIVFLFLATFLYSVGIRILPWILIGEVFPNEYRAKASGVASALGYVIGFIPNKIFLSLVFSITLPGVFLFYSILGLLGVGLLYFVLPETEGKSLLEISDHFSGVSKLGNDVRRGEEKKAVNQDC